MKEVLPGHYGKWRKLGVYAVTAILVYLVIRFLAVAVFPALTAVLLVRLLYPTVAWIRKKLHISSGITIFLFTIILMGIVGIILWWLVQKLFSQLGEVLQNLDVYQAYMENFVYSCCSTLEKSCGLRAEYVKPYLLGSIYDMGEHLRTSVGDGLVVYSYHYAKGLIKIIGVIVVVLVMTVLIAKDYDKLRAQLQASAFYENITRLKNKTLHAAFVYLRAQLILMVLITALCCLVLFLLGVSHAYLIGTGIGVLDALPFFGVGSVLVPWAIVQLLRGKVLSAAVLCSLYLVCSFLREFLEPKLIGGKLGVLPVYIVGTVYAGLVLYGVAGVVLGPMQALLTIEISRQWIEEHSSHTKKDSFID